MFDARRPTRTPTKQRQDLFRCTGCSTMKRSTSAGYCPSCGLAPPSAPRFGAEPEAIAWERAQQLVETSSPRAFDPSYWALAGVLLACALLSGLLPGL